MCVRACVRVCVCVNSLANALDFSTSFAFFHRSACTSLTQCYTFEPICCCCVHTVSTHTLVLLSVLKELLLHRRTSCTGICLEQTSGTWLPGCDNRDYSVGQEISVACPTGQVVISCFFHRQYHNYCNSGARF